MHSPGEDGRVKCVSHDLHRMGAVGPALPDEWPLCKAERKGAAYLKIKKKKNKEKENKKEIKSFQLPRNVNPACVLFLNLQSPGNSFYSSNMDQGAFKMCVAAEERGVRGKRHI